MDITTTETINDNFAKSFAVAEVFPEILSQLTREILREQPNNIHEFGMFLIILYNFYKLYLLYT